MKHYNFRNLNMRFTILLILITLACSKSNFKTNNITDVTSPVGALFMIMMRNSFSGFGGSSSQARLVFSYADRIILVSESYSSTAPYVWVSTDGTTFTKYSVKLGDCVGTSGTSSVGCIISYVGYENGTYAIYGHKSNNTTGSSTISTQYFGKGTDLSSITVNTTSPGATIGSDAPILFTSGKLHVSKSGTTNYIYSTTDGSSWTPVTVTSSCYTMYLADSGTPSCSLANYYNGTTWVTAGAITGGGGQVSTYSRTNYLDSAFYAWQNNSGTLSIYKSTSGSIISGQTFPGVADSSVTLSNTYMNPSKIVKTTGGVYLMQASHSTSSVNINSWIRSTNGTSWSIFTPTFPSDLGTFQYVYGLGSLGNNFFATVGFKNGSNTSFYLLKSSDGQTWTKVSL